MLLSLSFLLFCEQYPGHLQVQVCVLVVTKNVNVPIAGTRLMVLVDKTCSK